MLEIDHASGIYLFDTSGNRYMDLNSGYCVSSLGHCHPQVVSAIQQQASSYLHTSVYGEHVQSPQVRLAQKLTAQLDPTLDCVFFVNSGAEAVEGAMKLAKRYTGRPEIIACRNAYHGSTQGADSLRSDLAYTNAFMPLLPGIRHITFSDQGDLSQITTQTAAVIIEPVQGEAGVRLPAQGYLNALRERCSKTGALLIFDEIQTGIGRTGTFCAHEQYGVVPDILLLAKALGAGMPLGAIVSRQERLSTFTTNPPLGHLTTFGGHPVCCAAALAGLEVLLDSGLLSQVNSKADYFVQRLQHPAIKEIRYSGLLMAVELKDGYSSEAFCALAMSNGLITDYFLFNKHSFRIAPPLIITPEEIDMICEIILSVLDSMA
jgi:acetylornithine/succinyldiaminopimelate/putrescine aminotransferase